MVKIYLSLFFSLLLFGLVVSVYPACSGQTGTPQWIKDVQGQRETWGAEWPFECLVCTACSCKRVAFTNLSQLGQHGETLKHKANLARLYREEQDQQRYKSLSLVTPSRSARVRERLHITT